MAARFTREDEEAGAREHFQDAALYDFEYRRRRADVNFYRTLCQERGGPILDLACGTGRLLVPLLRDGHTVVGLDRSLPMLARAKARLARLNPTRRRRGHLIQGDMRRFALKPRFGCVIAAFHSFQHLTRDTDWTSALRSVRSCLQPDGWLMFDVLPPDPRWLARDPERRWARTTFRHPTSGRRYAYTTNHRFDPKTHLLHIRLYYQPIDDHGDPTGREIIVRLCHRQMNPTEVTQRLAIAGFRVLMRYGGFDGRPPRDALDPDDEHIYVARPATSILRRK